MCVYLYVCVCLCVCMYVCLAAHDLEAKNGRFSPEVDSCATGPKNIRQ